MPFIIGLAVVILAISLRNLISMENSLEEGRGPQGEILLMTIPMMVLVASLMLLMVNESVTGPKALREKLPITALMLAMFIIGMLIEPWNHLPTSPDTPNRPHDFTIGPQNFG